LQSTSFGQFPSGVDTFPYGSVRRSLPELQRSGYRSASGKGKRSTRCQIAFSAFSTLGLRTAHSLLSRPRMIPQSIFVLKTRRSTKLQTHCLAATTTSTRSDFGPEEAGLNRSLGAGLCRRFLHPRKMSHGPGSQWFRRGCNLSNLPFWASATAP
jgi:hypothetical protein